MADRRRWLSRRRAAPVPASAVWVSLDQTEQNPQQFLACRVAELQTVDARIGASAWTLLQATPPPPARTVRTGLINSVARYPEARLLVLDGHHLVACKAVDDALAFFIDHLPPQLHLALARLRGHGQVTELRQQDLRVAANEATTLLAQAMAFQLSAAHVAVLAARTDGWVAGLQPAAISLQDHPNPDPFIQPFSGSRRHLQDFLLAEVLLRQSPALQTFLLRTAVLDRLCGALCDAVTQVHNSQDMLAYLAQANPFVVTLDAEQRGFRSHQPFAEVLRQRLQQHEPSAPLLVRASKWYEAKGQAVDALQQAIAIAIAVAVAVAVDDIGRAIGWSTAAACLCAWFGWSISPWRSASSDAR